MLGRTPNTNSSQERSSWSARSLTVEGFCLDGKLHAVGKHRRTVASHPSVASELHGAVVHGGPGRKGLLALPSPTIQLSLAFPVAGKCVAGRGAHGLAGAIASSTGSQYGLNVASSPPTKKQLALLRKLAVEKNQTFAEPRDVKEASEQISRLMALRSGGYYKNRRTARGGQSRTRAKNVG